MKSIHDNSFLLLEVSRLRLEWMLNTLFLKYPYFHCCHMSDLNDILMNFFSISCTEKRKGNSLKYRNLNADGVLTEVNTCKHIHVKCVCIFYILSYDCVGRSWLFSNVVASKRAVLRCKVPCTSYCLDLSWSALSSRQEGGGGSVLFLFMGGLV